MNNAIQRNSASTIVGMAVAVALLAACVTPPIQADGVAAVRQKLDQLRADPQLADRAPVAVKDADAAVRAAEMPQTDAAVAHHLVFVADRKVDTAKALASTSLAEDQRTALQAQRDKARLDARTREVDVANGQAARARAESAEAKSAADQSRLAADSARLAAADSQNQSAELQRQIDEMHAKVTDRGVVLTLGDVLFTTGRADLRMAATGNLDKLAAFLTKYPDRTAVVEGYTDTVGSAAYNQALSERRADGVKSYLVRQGVGSERLTSRGKGSDGAVASNDSAEGRQQNRRVEVVISNPPAASL